LKLLETDTYYQYKYSSKVKIHHLGIRIPYCVKESRRVGMTGFEPAASSSRTKRATGLRYIPKATKVRCAAFLQNILHKYRLYKTFSNTHTRKQRTQLIITIVRATFSKPHIEQAADAARRFSSGPLKGIACRYMRDLYIRKLRLQPVFEPFQARLLTLNMTEHYERGLCSHMPQVAYVFTGFPLL
jgi:hypothetical protein